MNETKHTPGPIRLYRHVTDGGAEYLSDKYLECQNDHKEGVFENACIIVRLDGEPEVQLLGEYAAAPDLLEACQQLVEEAKEDDQNPSLVEAFSKARAAIAKATT